MYGLNRVRLFVLMAIFCLGISFIPGLLQAQEAPEEPPFSFDLLGNLTYQNEHVEGGQVTLVDGLLAEAVADGSELQVVAALTGYIAYGDLNGDEVEDAAAVLVTDGGDDMVFLDLAVVVDERGVLSNVATITLGDRVNISDLFIIDGQIVVDMVTQGPDDDMCCPTLGILRTYALGEAGLILVAEEEEEGANTARFNPQGDPTVAMIFMGMEDQFWLDPMLVSLHTGAMAGPAIQASTLGINCAGVIDERPEVVLQWTENESVDVLRIFLLSMGDPTLVVVTPDGDILCSDDMNPLVLDPYLEIENPVGGRYAIYAGSFDEKANTAGFLVVTSQDLSPATLDLGQMFPRQIVPDAIGEPLTLDDLALDKEPTGGVLTETLTITNTPFVQELVAGGSVGAYNVDFGNDLCTGFIDATPTFAFDWDGEAEKLVLFYEGEADTTLIVQNPNGDFQCNDDASGAANLNPYLDLTPIPGHYVLWVGSFAPDVTVEGSLTIAGTTDVQPIPLTAEMIDQQ